MRITYNPSILSMKSFSQAASLVVMLLGGLVLLGWIFGIPLLKSILPELASMKPNTALGFIVVGLALWLLLKPESARWEQVLAWASIIFVTLLGLLTLSEYVFHLDLGIDQLLFYDVLSGPSNPIPGRMSQVTALNFFFIGLALVFFQRKSGPSDKIAQFLVLMITFFSGLGLLGYAYGATVLYAFGTFNSIALHTTIAFVIAAAGLLCAYPDRGLMTIVTSQNAGGFMARSVLPSAILLPVILGWLRFQGEKAGFYDGDLGSAIMVSSNIVVIVGIILWNASLLNRTDADLKFAQAADLRKNEERLRYVVWAIRDAIWDRNMVSGEIWWNEGLRKLFRYTDTEIKPTEAWWRAHIHPDDQQKVVKSIQKSIDTGQKFWSEEYRFQRADGSYANIFDRSYILYRDQDGQPERMIGAMADITEQKQAEQALRQSEELFAKAFSASPAGFTLTRQSDGHVLEVNAAYLSMVGYSREEVLNHTTIELGLIFPEDRARLLKIFEEQGRVRNFEHWVQTKSGALRAVLSSFEQVLIGDTTCFIAIIYDITERKQSEALFRALFELSPDSVVIIDPHAPDVSWPIIDCNAAACFMNGYRRDELIGRSIDVLNGTSASPSERQAYMELLHEKGILKAEFQHRSKDGRFFPIETSTTLINIGERELIIGIDRNITERKQAEELLYNTNEKLKNGLAELDQRNREMMLLTELSNLLQACQTSDDAYMIIGQTVSKIFPNTEGALYIINHDKSQAEAAVVWGALSPEEHVFAQNNCLALHRRRPHFVGEAHPSVLCKHVLDQPVASICVPMSSQEGIFGIFHLRHSDSQPHKTIKLFDEGLVETVADTVALAITNLMLRETLRNQSIRDPLTGLFNRRFMDESLERELHRAERSQRTLGVIMLDLDHFKKFNDSYGHEAGDDVLRALGDFLKRHIRKGDIPCRYGGEEFLLLLPEASLKSTLQRAEKLCSEVTQLTVEHREKSLGGLTLSIGVSVFPTHGISSDDLVRAADMALYRAKQAGRNRVVVADSL